MNVKEIYVGQRVVMHYGGKEQPVTIESIALDDKYVGGVAVTVKPSIAGNTTFSLVYFTRPAPKTIHRRFVIELEDADLERHVDYWMANSMREYFEGVKNVSNVTITED